MALFGFTPRGPGDIPPSGPQPTKVPAARDRATYLRTTRKELVGMLRRSQEDYRKWYNKGRTPHLFHKNEWVLLSTKTLRQSRPTRKFADKYLGPYQIEEVVGHHGLAYKLRLPSKLRLHSTFPISSLEPYRLRSGEAPSSPVLNPLLPETTYEVEAILDHKGPRRNRSYLIKWKDYDTSENSWEPRKNLDDGPILQNYEQSLLSPANSM
jgi:hypothetical protein